MQTITLEFRTDDLVALGVVPGVFFEKYEEVELLETLRLERGWRLQLLRLRRNGPLRSDEELERESRRIRRMYGLESFEVVERRPHAREYILLVRQRNPASLRALVSLSAGKITPIAPFRLNAETTTATFRGEESTLRRVLARLRKEEMPFRIVRASSRPVLADAIATELTAKQRDVLARAWALGFFSVPRKITLTRLAKTTGQSPPALGKMLRRADGHRVATFLSVELPGAFPEPVPSEGRGNPQVAVGRGTPVAGRAVSRVVLERVDDAPDVPLPATATAGSTGFDVASAEDVLLEHGKVTLVRTGWRMRAPRGTFLEVRPRSGLSTRGVLMVNAPGTIDRDYAGEVKIPMTFLWGGGYQIRVGDRIAQVRLVGDRPAKFTLGEVRPVPSRSGGFGSTGR